MLYFIGFFLAFVIVLIIIIIIVFKKSSPKKCDINPQPTKKERTLTMLVDLLKKEKKELKALNGLVDEMIENFPFPEEEKEANRHFEFVYFYAKNPLTTAKMIVQMQKKVCAANPKYAKQIEDYQIRGVDARKK